MSGKRQRRWRTVGERLADFREADQADVTAADACRRSAISRVRERAESPQVTGSAKRRFPCRLLAMAG